MHGGVLSTWSWSFNARHVISQDIGCCKWATGITHESQGLKASKGDVGAMQEDTKCSTGWHL